VLVTVTGCGSDDEPAAAPPPRDPQLTIPETNPEPAPEDTTETTEAAPAPPTTETTPAPEPEPPADTPENDTPPPQDSPAERFEDFCNDNPGACG
jgi:hypothetical protein